MIYIKPIEAYIAHLRNQKDYFIAIGRNDVAEEIQAAIEQQMNLDQRINVIKIVYQW